MARKTYVQDPVTFELIPKEDYYRAQDVDAPMVMSDIAGYKSMIDGSWIGSRSSHRSHLKQHNCIEIGNETKTLMSQVKRPSSPPGLKDALLREFHKRNM